ncbi:MAG: ATP synthase F1 subunit delta [Oscillospiraceae bacterium]|nr:ATP synthase F1 subunit delta [Oscillospiraceae bacterium]
MAKKYGAALYSLAKEEGAAEDIMRDMKSVTALFEKNSGYVKILDSPRIKKGEITDILTHDFGGRVHIYTLNFLRLLCEKRMAHRIDECFKEYERRYNADNNIRIVKVTTAKPLSKPNEDKLTKKLERKTGGRVVLKKRIDEKCLGGIIIETDGVRIDMGIKTELENLKKELIQN